MAEGVAFSSKGEGGLRQGPKGSWRELPPKTLGAIMFDFPRIKRLPPYVFAIVDEFKMKARKAGYDIVDFGMGNPDQPTPDHIVDKLIEAVGKT